MEGRTTKSILRFLSHNTIALIALFVALGGTAYAATALPRNSVGTAQLKKNAVTSVKVKDNSLTGADILESSLGKVPSAASADNASNATHATSADSATNATHATKADSATSATHATSADSATIATHATSADSATSATHATSADSAASAAPSGTAGGNLSGSYPNPALAAGAVTDGSFSGTGAPSVAEAGGVIVVSGGVPSVSASFDRLSTAAITVTRNAAGYYEVTIPGMSYHFTNEITEVTLIDSGTAVMARTSSFNGHLLVYTRDAAGTLVDPLGFSFVVYK